MSELDTPQEWDILADVTFETGLSLDIFADITAPDLTLAIFADIEGPQELAIIFAHIR